jgi:hypothetical protein
VICILHSFLGIESLYAGNMDNSDTKPTFAPQILPATVDLSLHISSNPILTPGCRPPSHAGGLFASYQLGVDSTCSECHRNIGGELFRESQNLLLIFLTLLWRVLAILRHHLPPQRQPQKGSNRKPTNMAHVAVCPRTKCDIERLVGEQSSQKVPGVIVHMSKIRQLERPAALVRDRGLGLGNATYSLLNVK